MAIDGILDEPELLELRNRERQSFLYLVEPRIARSCSGSRYSLEETLAKRIAFKEAATNAVAVLQ